MEKPTFLDVLDEKIDGKSINKLRNFLTRALETIWDPFFGHLGPYANLTTGTLT